MFSVTYLEQIQKRYKNASPPPWKSLIEGRDVFAGSDLLIIAEKQDTEATLDPIGHTTEDLDFIAAARKDIPDLVNEVLRLQWLGIKDLPKEKRFSPITQSHLTEIKIHSDKATRGPWISFVNRVDHHNGFDFVLVGMTGQMRFEGITKEDQDFIAHARQDIPVLLEEINRLRKEYREKDVDDGIR